MATLGCETHQSPVPRSPGPRSYQGSPLAQPTVGTPKSAFSPAAMQRLQSDLVPRRPSALGAIAACGLRSSTGRYHRPLGPLGPLGPLLTARTHAGRRARPGDHRGVKDPGRGAVPRSTQPPASGRGAASRVLRRVRGADRAAPEDTVGHAWSSRWGLIFRRNAFEITHADYRHIAHAMGIDGR